mmetsp:Transcript_2182/g.4647  ORF Transcript_2182/g.4647 Transcript_2182/m.4647 type:complete len:224 (-) Transcript_2182:474-1145(-)
MDHRQSQIIGKVSGCLEDHGVEHGAQALHDGQGHQLAHVVGQVPLGVDLAHIHHLHVLLGAPLLLLHPGAVLLGQAHHLLQHLRCVLLVLLELLHQQAGGPVFLVQVHEHLLLQVVLAPVDHQAVVVPVQPVDARLDGGLLEKPDVGGGLPRLRARHHHQLVGTGDHAKCVDHHLPLDALHGIHHHSDCARVQLLKGRLRVHIYPREPAAEAGVGVVPAHHHL